ncbi:hypothetical protein BKA70DRAFT_1436342 [Coprinopsis sp. MPI-PUGE-AT-0042]|nr:hypothetical protein BKA70DRAFT_1436342 [Coprinopsis sp. MPI-PUGE-AT-0042]
MQAEDVQTAHSPPLILHWDLTRDKLYEWAWPSDSETGERIPPSDLEGHRRTHHFMAPCCLCAISLDDMYIESTIGLAVVAPGSERRSEVSGEYIAQCAQRKCGYFVALERFYGRKVLKVKAYARRDTPLAAEELSYLSDIVYGDGLIPGLPQALPSSGIWSRGTNRCLAVEHPSNAQQNCAEFTNLWTRGVEE